MKEDLGVMNNETVGIKSSLDNLEGITHNLKADFQIIKADFQIIKDDFQIMKDDFQIMKADTKIIIASLEKMRTEMHRFFNRIEQQDHEDDSTN